MMKHFKTFLFLLLINSNSLLLAQENQEPEQIAAVDNAFENLFYEALTHKAIENHDKALATLEKCLEKDAKNPVIYHEMGKNYFALKQYADAENAFNKAVELNENERWYWNGLYDVYYEVKDYNNAIRIVKKLIPYSKEFEDDLVSLYMNTGQKDKAYELLVDMATRTNLSKTMEAYKFQLEKEQNNAKPNAKLLEDKIAKNPKDEQAYIDLIYLYSEQQQEEKAFEIAKRLTSELPNSEWAHVSLVKFYLNANQGLLATNSLFKILESNRMDAKIKHRAFNEYLIFVAHAPEFQNDLVKAIATFNDQKEVNVNKEVAKFFYNKNRTSEAVNYLEQSLKLVPEDAEAQDLLFLLYMNQKQIDKIQELAQNYLELYPSKPELYYYSGWSYLQKNDAVKAQKVFLEGLDFLVENPGLERKFYEQLALCYEQLGDAKKKQEMQLKAKNIKN